MIGTCRLFSFWFIDRSKFIRWFGNTMLVIGFIRWAFNGVMRILFIALFTGFIVQGISIFQVGMTSAILKDLFDFFINLWLWRVYRQDMTRRIGFMFDRWLIDNFGIASDLLLIDQKTWDFRLVLSLLLFLDDLWFIVFWTTDHWFRWQATLTLFTNKITWFFMDYVYCIICVYGIAGSDLIYWLLLFGAAGLAQRHSHNLSRYLSKGFNSDKIK